MTDAFDWLKILGGVKYVIDENEINRNRVTYLTICHFLYVSKIN